MPNGIWNCIMTNAASRASQLTDTFAREAEQLKETTDNANTCWPG